MRVRPTGPGMRTVGFDQPTRRQAKQIAAMRQSATPVRNARPIRPAADEDTRVQVNRRAVGISNNYSKKEQLRATEDFLKPVSTLDFDLSSKELKPDYSLKKRDLSAEAPKSRHNKKKQKTKKKHTARKVFLTLLVLILLAGGGMLLWGNNLIAKLTGGKSGIFDLVGVMGSNVKLKTDKNGRTNILVFGTSGYTMSGEVDEYGDEHDGSQLTDSIMVVSLGQETKDVAMVSLPRDLYVGNTCTSTGKVNEVYFCSNLDQEDEEDGVLALKNTIKEILGVDIQYYIHLDWGALIQVVDGIGGITVTLDEDIEDDWTGTYIQAGVPTELNGERALGLARARHGTEMGDFTRGNSQQKILSAIQNKLVNGGIDLGMVLNLVDAVGGNVRMDFSLEELKSAYYLAKDISLDSMRQVPLIDYKNEIVYLTTAEMNGISYVVPVGGIGYYTTIQKYINEQFKTPVPKPSCEPNEDGVTPEECETTSEESLPIEDESY